MSTETYDSVAGPAQAPVHPTERIVIEPPRRWVPLDLPEVWRYRELLLFLTWRDIKIRYKQTALGAAWAIIQPVFTVILFSIIFGRIARLPSAGVPYPMFAFAAILPWTYFAYVLNQSGNSLVSNANMISKVYFPRLLLPLSAALAGLVDFAITFAVLIVLMPYYHVRPGVGLLFLPLFLLMCIAAALSVGLWLSALNVQYRDVRHTLPFLIQVWLFASPVAYSASLVHGKLALVYALNPMTGVIQGFRWGLLGLSTHPGLDLLPSVIVTVVLLVGGLFYFQGVEQTFADVV